MYRKRLRKPAACASLIAACALGVLLASGCRTKPAPIANAPLSAEAAKAQARNKKIQQYITRRRTQARKASKTHTVH